MGEEAMQVLLVSDAKERVEALRGVLQSCGRPFHVTMVGTLDEARTCLGRIHPDLTIADQTLPDGRGADLIAPGRGLSGPTLLLTDEDIQPAAIEGARMAAPGPQAQPRPAPGGLLADDNDQDFVYLYRLTPERGFEYVSPSATTVTGYSPEDHYADRDLVDKTVHADDRHLHKAMLGSPAHHPVPVVLRSSRKDGAGIWVEQRLVPVHDASGCLVAALAIVRDITERERSARALGTSEARYRALFEAAGDVIFLSRIHDGEPCLIDCNQKALDLFGFTRQEILGNAAYALSPSVQPDGRPSRDKAREMIDAALQGTPQSFEWTHQRADGTCFEVEVSLNRVAVGDDLCLLSIVRDITARKRAEEQLAAHQAHLEELVKERTAELEEAHQELVKRERLAALGQLVATVNHEIRNPLMTIRGAIFLLAAKTRGKGLEVESLLERAERNIERCDAIIHDLLDYTRVRELGLQPTEVDEWLGAVLDEYTRPPGVTMLLNLDARTQVPLDRERLRRGLVNVMNNACEAMAKGVADAVADGRKPPPRELSISSLMVEQALQIQVSDTGPGIPSELLDKVMEPLYSTKSFGVGLGLPTVYETVKQHGGEMEVESELGRGTTVTLRLPLSRGAALQGGGD